MQNARAAADAGAAELIHEQDLDARRVRALIEQLLLIRGARTAMAERASAMGRPQAAKQMAAHLVETLGDALRQSVWTEELGG